jgi:lipopolysaccharide cholinephosphotransferase
MKFKAEDIVILDDEQLRDYQLHILDMAKDVIAFFDRAHIAYSLSGGSILGAIRHKGFIPWDDDIDLNMPRKDYNRMVLLFDRYLGDRYYLQTPKTHPELGLTVVQIRKKGTIGRRKYDWNLDECGISIDLYILENVFDDPLLRFIQKNMSMALSFAVSAIRFYNNRRLPRQIQELESRQFNYAGSKRIVGGILRLIPLKYWLSWCEYWFSACKDDRSHLVAIPTGRKHFSGEIYRRADMCAFKKVPFETELFNVPVWAKGYLKKFYGDYMKIPPAEQRERHVFLELKY